MKRLSLLTLLTLLTLLPAVKVGAAPEATPTANVKQIEDLKERLATKVAELRQSVRRAIAGTVKTVSVSTATIETKTKDVKIELTDDIVIVQYLKGKRTKLTLDDLAKDDRVVVFGAYDATLDILKAKVVFIQAVPAQRLTGTVTAVDTKEFTLTLTSPEGKTVIVDVEKTTKITLWDGQKMTKAGFSKIAAGDTLHVVGTAVPKKEDRVSASRILDVGNLTGGPSPAGEPTLTRPSTPSATPANNP